MKMNEVEYEGIKMYHSELSDSFTVVISLEGYLDTMNSSKVPDFLNTALSSCKGTKKVQLDLLKLTYASSTGIGAFTAILLSCKKQNIELELVHVASKIYDVILLLGFDSFFTIR